MRLAMQWSVILTLCGSIRAATPTTQLSEDDVAANMALGQRFAQLAQLSLGRGDIVEPTIRQSIALLKLANKLDPSDLGHLRLLIEGYFQLGGAEGRAGAIDVLNKYRQIAPADMAAQVRLIDLHFAQMDAADQRGRYVDQIVNTGGLAPELRSHAAVLGAKLAQDRGETERSNKLIDDALKLFPLNPIALDMKYRQLDPATPIAQRVALMLQMLRSNPAQADVMKDLGDAVASVGLVDPALNWYGASNNVLQRFGLPPEDETVTAVAAQLIISDQPRSAEQFVRIISERDPANSDIAFLNVLIQKRIGTPEKVATAIEMANTALVTRLSRISDTLNQREPTTLPSNSAGLDATADLKKLDEVQNPTLAAAYATGLADIAWLHLYFNGKPEEAQPPIKALRQILAPDSVTLARLDGWTYLVEGKKEEARVKLSAVAAEDPFSALGMLRLDADQSHDKLLAASKKLLMENSSGLMGALLIEALRDKVALMPLSPAAADVRAELDKFPKDWLDILDLAKAKNFYSLKVEPLKVPHAFGEAMFARVTIANVGQYPITVGNEGTLHRDLWVDVHIGGIVQQNLPGTAFDRFGQTVLLKPRESITQNIRVDQGSLAEAIQKNPIVSMPLNFSLFTNPMMQRNGVAPGPAGYRVQFSRVMERSPSPLDSRNVQKLYEQLESGRGDVRVRTLELLAAYAMVMKSQPDEATRSRAAEFVDLIRKGTADRSPAVRGLAMFVTAMLTGGETKDTIIKQMLGDEAYQVRAIVLGRVSSFADAEKCKVLLQPVVDGDPEPLLRELASAAIAVSVLGPATQPATQPADGAIPPPIMPTELKSAVPAIDPAPPLGRGLGR